MAIFRRLNLILQINDKTANYSLIVLCHWSLAIFVKKGYTSPLSTYKSKGILNGE